MANLVAMKKPRTAQPPAGLKIQIFAHPVMEATRPHRSNKTPRETRRRSHMDHYRILGLRSDATKEEIKEAFRSSALQFHPDRHSQSSQEVRDGASRRFRQASEAYEVLIDDRRRADYDLGRRGGRGGGASSSTHGAPRYGYGGSGGGSYSRPRPGKTVVTGLDFGFVFRYLTRRGFLVNVAFAGALLGGAVVIERSVESVWKMNNSGKSFEEAMESIEKGKVQNESSRGSEDPLIPGFSGDPS